VVAPPRGGDWFARVTTRSDRPAAAVASRVRAPGP